MKLIDAIDVMLEAADVAHEHIHDEDEHELLDAAMDVFIGLKHLIEQGVTNG